MAETYSSGTTPLPTNPKRVLWVKALTKRQQSGGSAKNDPQATNPTRRIKTKLLRSILGI